jgi:hypothetical protein
LRCGAKSSVSPLKEGVQQTLLVRDKSLGLDVLFLKCHFSEEDSHYIGMPSRFVYELINLISAK